jgi:hypothetical protein
MMYRKFGVTVPVSERVQVLYYPQMFLSMQFHMGARFRDILYHSQINNPGVMEPFALEDVVESCIPSIKISSVLPGELGVCERNVEDFLAVGLYAEAAQLYFLRVSVRDQLCPPKSTSTSAALQATAHRLSTANARSASLNRGGGAEETKQSSVLSRTAQYDSVYPTAHFAARAHDLYKYAVCCYLACSRAGFSPAAYKTPEMAAATSALKSFIANNAKYSVIVARMLSLLMCVEFKLGYIDTARSYFDAAQEIYIYVLGPYHPILSLHLCMFGDLYKASKNYSQAKVLLFSYLFFRSFCIQLSFFCRTSLFCSFFFRY